MQAAEVRHVLFEGQLAVDVDPGQHLKLRVTFDQVLGPRRIRGVGRRGPPVPQRARPVELAARGVETERQLVPDHRAQRTELADLRAVRAEERLLHDCRLPLDADMTSQVLVDAMAEIPVSNGGRPGSSRWTEISL